MNAASPWVMAVSELFNDQDLPSIYQASVKNYQIKIHQLNNAVWVAIDCPGGSRVVLRTVYSPNDNLKIQKIIKKKDEVFVHLLASMGVFKVKLSFLDADAPIFRYTTSLKPSGALLIPFWPRDMVILGQDGSYVTTDGTIYLTQTGTRTGMQYLSMDSPKSGTLLYFQNLTALNDYAQVTETSMANVVGGKWPELGFALPPAKDKPIPPGKEIVIADAFLAFNPENPDGETEMAKQFLDLLASVYLHLPRPETKFHNWPDILNNGLYDLQNSHACWSHGAGQDYLNAYVADYATPPELMVQLAVLLPLTDYHDWSKEDLLAIKKIQDGLDAFYNKKLGTVVRWLPALADQLNGSEEQLKPNVMDSWYLHHPLLNLGRLALRGNKQGERLFLSSLDFTIKVARHFKYEWPVFYNMETLEVVKAETKPGKGGEKDVAGLYALVMMHAWALTHQNKYLLEAKKAAKTLEGKGFELFYQANNTAFSANALLWLYKETKENTYLDLAYLCIANIFKNFQLWECNYGYAKYYATFFAMFPLGDAPYTAAYEEQEVFAAMHNFLLYADDEPILPSVSMLLPEFLKYIVNRAAYYYPPNLPEEMLSDRVKMGQLDAKLWIAIEDIHDGWEKSGEVGQEVYGAGVAFGIVPRHYYRVPGEEFMVFVEYPAAGFKKTGKRITFKVKGDARLTCRMVITRPKKEKMPSFSVKAEQNKVNSAGKPRKGGDIEYTIHGGDHILLTWD